MQIRRKPAALIAAAVIGLGATASQAATHTATLTALNSGVGGEFLDVNGNAKLDYDGGNMLNVMILASGLKPGERHAQHIHGVLGGDSRTPTLADDADGDGVIELLDGVGAYGPVLISLVNANGKFPKAKSNGTLSFSMTYDLSDSATFADAAFSRETVLPLNFREIVLHGGTLAEGVGGIPEGGPRAVEEADGSAGYKPILPVAAGQISAVPVPAAGFLLLAGLGGLMGLRRKAS